MGLPQPGSFNQLKEPLKRDLGSWYVSLWFTLLVRTKTKKRSPNERRWKEPKKKTNEGGKERGIGLRGNIDLGVSSLKIF